MENYNNYWTLLLQELSIVYIRSLQQDLADGTQWKLLLDVCQTHSEKKNHKICFLGTQNVFDFYFFKKFPHVLLVTVCFISFPYFSQIPMFSSLSPVHSSFFAYQEVLSHSSPYSRFPSGKPTHNFLCKKHEMNAGNCTHLNQVTEKHAKFTHAHNSNIY